MARGFMKFMRARGFLVGLAAVSSVLFLPGIFYPQSYFGVPSLAWQLLLIVVFTIGTWLALKVIWHVWTPNSETEDRLTRTVVGALAGALFVFAVLAAQATSHSQCVYGVGHGEDAQCLAWEEVPGADLFMVIVLAGAGAAAFYISMAKPQPKSEGRQLSFDDDYESRDE